MIPVNENSHSLSNYYILTLQSMLRTLDYTILDTTLKSKYSPYHVTKTTEAWRS